MTSTFSGLAVTGAASALTDATTLDLSSNSPTQFTWVGAQKLIATAVIATYALAF